MDIAAVLSGLARVPSWPIPRSTFPIVDAD